MNELGQKVTNGILNDVKSRYVKNEHFLDEISRLLGISKSGLYGKLNGRTSFSFSEIIEICQRYKLSLDYFAYQENLKDTPYAFLSDALHKESNDLDFFTNILDHLSSLYQLKNVHGTYLTNELPLFYYLMFPELLEFKIYVWKFVNPTFDESIMDGKLVTSEIWKLAEQITKVYFDFPTVEIWNPNLFDNLLRQIFYFSKFGKYRDKNNLLSLFNSLNKLILLIERSLKEGRKLFPGKKDLGGKLTILTNDFFNGNEQILIESDNWNAIYVKYDTPNYIRSYDERVCNHASIYLKHIVGLASNITTSNLIDRMKFIEEIKEKIEVSKRKVLL